MVDGAAGSTPSVILAEPPVDEPGWKAVPRTVKNLMGSVDWTVSTALPAKMGRVNSMCVSGGLCGKLKSGWAR